MVDIIIISTIFICLNKTSSVRQVVPPKGYRRYIIILLQYLLLLLLLLLYVLILLLYLLLLPNKLSLLHLLLSLLLLLLLLLSSLSLLFVPPEGCLRRQLGVIRRHGVQYYIIVSAATSSYRISSNILCHYSILCHDSILYDIMLQYRRSARAPALGRYIVTRIHI